MFSGCLVRTSCRPTIMHWSRSKFLSGFLHQQDRSVSLANDADKSLCFAGAEVPMPYAANLEKAALPQIADVVRVVKRVMGKQ